MKIVLSERADGFEPGTFNVPSREKERRQAPMMAGTASAAARRGSLGGKP